MKFKTLFNRRLFVLIALSVVGGILSAALPIQYGLLILFATIIFVGFCFLNFKKDYVVLISMLVFLVLGNILFNVNDLKQPQYNINWDDGVKVEGRICQQRKVYENRFEFVLDKLTIDGKPYPHKMRVKAYYDYTLKSYSYGDVISVDAQVNLNASALDEATPQEHARFLCDRIAYEGKTDISTVEKIGHINNPIMTPLMKYKNRVIQVIYRNMSLKNAQLTVGVLFGTDSVIDDELRSDFNVSGVSHILSVSGLHVGFLMIFLKFILKRLKLSPKAQFIVSILILLIYITLTAFSITVIRAAIMAVLFMLANLYGRRYDMFNALGLAVTLILLASPAEIFDVSLVLSVMSMVGIILIYDIYKKIVKTNTYLVRGAGITLSAQIGTLPLTGYYFGTFSVISVFTNMLIVPLSGALVFGSLIGVIVELINPYSSAFIFRLCQYIAEVIVMVAHSFAQSKLATIDIPFIGVIASIIYFVFLFVVSKYLLISTKKKIYIASGLLGCIILFGIRYIV